jgi:Flp pilus assembly protein TadG
MPTRVCRQRGQSTIETALVVVVIFTVVFWIFEICMLMYTYTVITDAANEGARYAIVHTNVVADDSRVKDRVLTFAKLSMHNVNAISTTVTLPDGTNVPPNRVRVKVTYTYIPYLSLIGTPPHMSAYSEARMVVK